MCNRAITVSSFLFLRGQTIHSFSIGNIYQWTSGDLCTHVIGCVLLRVCVYCLIGNNGNLSYNNYGFVC